VATSRPVSDCNKNIAQLVMYIEQELFDILRGFASLQPTNSLKWPRSISFARTHDFLLNSVLLDSHFSSYPPSVQYQWSFWKWAVENMERALQEMRPGVRGFLCFSSKLTDSMFRLTNLKSMRDFSNVFWNCCLLLARMCISNVGVPLL
jgi:hypothetical protein